MYHLGRRQQQRLRIQEGVGAKICWTDYWRWWWWRSNSVIDSVMPTMMLNWQCNKQFYRFVNGGTTTTTTPTTHLLRKWKSRFSGYFHHFSQHNYAPLISLALLTTRSNRNCCTPPVATGSKDQVKVRISIDTVLGPFFLELLFFPLTQNRIIRRHLEFNWSIRILNLLRLGPLWMGGRRLLRLCNVFVLLFCFLTGRRPKQKRPKDHVFWASLHSLFAAAAAHSPPPPVPACLALMIVLVLSPSLK